jgi:hypothetical protein
MPKYNRVKYYSLNRPYWDIEVIPEPSPSPSQTPTITPTPTNTPTITITPTTTITPSITPTTTITPSITPTPSATPTGIYPNMNLSGASAWSSTWTGDYSYYGIGYLQPYTSNYRTGTAPNGKNYAVYTKNTNPDNIIMVITFDPSNNRVRFQLINATSKTSSGWTDGEATSPNTGIYDSEWADISNECLTDGIYHLCAGTYNNNNPSPSIYENIITYSY